MPDWFGEVGGWVALVVFLGAVAGYLRGSRDKGTIATLESSNEALLQWQDVAKGQIGELKASAAAAAIKHKAEVEALGLRLTALEAERDDLLKQRPSAAAIQALRDRLEMHDAVTLAAIAEVSEYISDIGKDPT